MCGIQVAVEVVEETLVVEEVEDMEVYVCKTKSPENVNYGEVLNTVLSAGGYGGGGRGGYGGGDGYGNGYGGNGVESLQKFLMYHGLVCID